ncbi:MAG: alkaline phosphatase family protein [Pseudobacteriovorax sp.]|nr:alkaline phosphatase family protein [Pseudobacteriovorax sp.]
MHHLTVLNIVGLTPELIDEESTPYLAKFFAQGSMRPIKALAPAVTCTMQSTFLTGSLPCDHGIVGNGWYFKDLAEVGFWKQANSLVQGEMVWDAAKKRNEDFRSSQLFWWYNMYGSADISVTPRPLYPADGRKIPDIYTYPQHLRHKLSDKLGTFPLFNFWGPKADITSSRWIANCALEVRQRFHPHLNLVYIPHLDYNLQRLGPYHPEIKHDLKAVDALAEELIEDGLKDGGRVMVLSEYGITPVSASVSINRHLRQAGFVGIKEELGYEMLDAGASEAFAVCDHQIAHVYVKNPNRIQEVKDVLTSVSGIENVYSQKEELSSLGLDHSRSGDIICISDADKWFDYYFWLDDDLAPDYARTVDIHRKPGYDPVELFIDPKITFPMLKLAGKLAKKKLGFRTLMDVIPLDTSLVKGSHGRVTDRLEYGPLVASSLEGIFSTNQEFIEATDIKGMMLQHIFEDTIG